MSLQVWLPLVSDKIENQGLANLTFTNTSPSVIKINNSGKIGKCWERTNHSTNYIRSKEKIDLTRTQSMFCWINFSSLNAEYKLTGICGNHRYPTMSNMGITIRYVSNTTGYVSCNTGNGSTRTYVDYYGKTLLQANTWYHIGFTYDGTNIRFYVNGNLDGTSNYPNQKTTPEYVLLYNWAFNSTFNDNVSDYSSPFRLNDIRMYDHCLSAAEVKDLAKGLVAHYPLKDPYIEPTTNVAPIQNYNIRSKSTWGGHTYWSEKLSSVGSAVPAEQVDHFILQYNGSGGGGGSIFCASTPIKSNTTYCYSVYIKASDNFQYVSANFLYRYEYASKDSSGSSLTEGGVFSRSRMIPLGNGWYRCWGLFKSHANSASVSLCFFSYPGKNTEYWIGCPQLEEKDHLTPYVFGTRNETIIEDVSGNGYDGVKYNSILPSNNSIRNQYSYLFNGSNTYIDCHRHAMVKDQITVSWWGYMDDWSKYTRAISCTCGGGWNFQKGSSKMCVPCFINGDYKNVYDSILLSNISKGWHLFAFTYDGKDLKIYRDGQSTGTTHVSDTLHPIQYAGGNSILIGAEASGSSAPAGDYFKGNISDVRIYGTALSNEDIQKLYQSPVKISKNGTLITNGEFIEC